ncbi:autotransporter outer membrane beta-barrel domain-containing protein [Snodgrassella sp. ESL0253]|uniref:autotransporter outer membrane beta-barrel domain-containing protein n=1 Tax=Snodgrassella sp. ESL0253 TaxID=2705031 RepID=UPI001583C87E|nr:autotransporter outer membrane beta-barrel domain-containing protein [Snodgrassella sp. ESL0253]NUE65742.1 autotransporter outer membrane beta-barrel domain-containing protein [Snodgrassella sp. ESL0253]
MNRIYKSKWSESTQTWVACSELARGKIKNNCSKIVVAIALALTSISSYAACNSLDINVSNEKCKLTGLEYNSISAKNHATINIEGDKVVLNSNRDGRIDKTIALTNNSSLTAKDVETTNSASGDGNRNALSLNNSEADIQKLTAKTAGKDSIAIKASNNSRLSVNGDIKIQETAPEAGNGIENDNSRINVGSNINIDALQSIKGQIAISNNNNGQITATNINITTSNTNYAISQGGEENTDTSSITTTGDLNIKTKKIVDNNEAIHIQSGDLSVGGKTIISMIKDTNEVTSDDVSAIFVSNGNYTANGGAEIKIKNELNENYNDIKGIILGNDGHFINNGEVTVNSRKNIVIATDRRLFAGKEAVFHNKANGEIITDSADIVVHNSNGTLKIDNEGRLESTAGSVLKSTRTNEPDSILTVKNTNILSGKVDNFGKGRIYISNEKLGKIASNINNHATGDIFVKNTGTITGEITNNGNGRIVFENNGTFTGTANNAKNTNSNITFKNNGTFTGTTDNPGANEKIDLTNQGTWINTRSSTLSQLANTTGIIKFPKIPITDINDKNKYHTITVQGNYKGGGTLIVNTLWNKDIENSYSDQLIIKGHVSGKQTTVETEQGIFGDITKPAMGKLRSTPVIIVHDQNSSIYDFTGEQEILQSVYKTQLQGKKVQQEDGRIATEYAWTLTADPSNPAQPDPTDPAKPIKPTLPKEVLIYAEPVSGYVQMPTADMELGFTTIGTLHERRGENQTYNITSANNTALGDKQQQTWGRVLVKHLDKNGKRRLDTAGNQSVLQIGHDFILDENDQAGTRRHIGGYVAYGHNENDFRDQYRAENGYIVDDHYTGKGRTDAVSVGGYGTFYGNNGGYVDLVGQVTYLRNKYNARTNESVHQNGWGAAVSAEAGKSFTVYGNNWFVEPQAQLVYQYLSLDNFNDGIRHIDQHNPSALRGRVGMRFGYNGATTDNLPPSSFYGIANIWHDFVNPKSVDIGRDSLKEEYAKTWGEVGVGIQLPITRQSHFYGDVRYEKNFGSDKRKGFKGTVGYKYTWL